MWRVIRLEDNRLRIKDLPLDERPYEKLEKYGAEVLSNAELIAVIIRSGGKNNTSVELAQRIIKEFADDGKIGSLNNISLRELKNIKGIGKVKAIQIKAALELSRRINSFRSNNKVKINSPVDVSKYLMEDMRYLMKEHFKIVTLNTKNEIIKCIDVSIGTLNASLVHPREVFSEPLKDKCSSIILVHNHPSGDPTPSQEDITTTKRLVQAGEILGIHVLDHIIIGDGKFVSLKERSII